ncbi:MAG: GNAT family N-acetyltransferase [Oculatellaceae cyanobacterium Prado106]|jgi:ribosomal protein S18 acetylase RimI-like enzyme|nr:GNAT family N-acetyltransferase [Oculatellaceae cyanobacterium Prado106]
MVDIQFQAGRLTPEEQAVVDAGFDRHCHARSAPAFDKVSFTWSIRDGQALIGVLTADLLWDWLYVDELWVDERYRGQGWGKTLMERAEDYAVSQQLVGLWLWTQSWQAADFYQRLGYQEFARFEDFPRGHSRIGFRKHFIGGVR